MKFRNFANKFLLVALLVILSLGQTAVQSVALPVQTLDASAPSKTYYFDDYNYQGLADQSVYDALGIKVYNDYLSAVQAQRGLKNVVIAVLDSGLNPEHPVFENRILENYAMDFSHGATMSFLSNRWDEDVNGHGTHVAGILADLTLNNVKILPIKVLDGYTNKVLDGFALENAIRYLVALKRGVSAKLINSDGYEDSNLVCNKARAKLNIVAVNLSLGTSGFDVNNTQQMADFNKMKYGYTEGNVHYTGYQDCIDHLIKYGILPISAAGNLVGNENKRNTYYALPGACDGVLSVSAYDNTEARYGFADFSYHNDVVSLAAPGMSIWSACSQNIVNLLDTLDSDKSYDDAFGSYNEYKYNGISWQVRKDESGVSYLRSDGTSMATPFVTACYAMLMGDVSKTSAEDFGLTVWNTKGEDKHYMSIQHKALLAAAATYGDQGAIGHDDYFGYGVLSMAAFATETMSEPLVAIKYEIEPSTTYQDNDLSDRVNDEEADWYRVCWLLLLGAFLIWGFSYFRSYFSRRKIYDNEPERPTFE